MGLFFCGVVLSHYNSYNLSNQSQVRKEGGREGGREGPRREVFGKRVRVAGSLIDLIRFTHATSHPPSLSSLDHLGNYMEGFGGDGRVPGFPNPTPPSLLPILPPSLPPLPRSPPRPFSKLWV